VVLLTIGVYGSNEAGFFSALKRARVDLFVDVRRHRGLRGRTYAYANAKALVARLADLDIPYVHLPGLAPTREAITAQNEADRAAGLARRARQEVDPGFVEAYERDVLADLDPAEVRARLGDAERPVLFCVEGPAGACHRSLLARHLAETWDCEVRHLRAERG